MTNYLGGNSFKMYLKYLTVSRKVTLCFRIYPTPEIPSASGKELTRTHSARYNGNMRELITERYESGKTEKLFLLSLPALLGGVLAAYLYISGNSAVRLFPCFLFERFGVPCPACGVTRSVCAVLTFRFYEAIRYNAAFFCIFFYFAGVYCACVRSVLLSNRFTAFPAISVTVAAAGIAVFAIVRNLPFYPWQML